ncbi:hypothetical protein Pelo_3945 [Pelomyxa schiedti]|nr:hypothetical protein Pelo_3945 [Pelomyxa schiedti]
MDAFANTSSFQPDASCDLMFTAAAPPSLMSQTQQGSLPVSAVAIPSQQQYTTAAAIPSQQQYTTAVPPPPMLPPPQQMYPSMGMSYIQQPGDLYTQINKLYIWSRFSLQGVASRPPAPQLPLDATPSPLPLPTSPPVPSVAGLQHPLADDSSLPVSSAHDQDDNQDSPLVDSNDDALESPSAVLTFLEKQQQKTTSRLDEAEAAELSSADEEATDSGTTWSQMRKNPEEVLRVFHFTVEWLDNFLAQIVPILEDPSRKGARPKMSAEDAVLFYLAILTEKGTANSAALRAIERVRPVIYRELHDYWMKRPFNHIPKPVTEDKFGFIAVIADHTPIIINKPYALKTPTSDAFIHQVKAYDKHHGFHAVKKHVVSAMAPHYCVAIGKACAGATSDKTDFDELWSSLYPPLLKRKPDDTSFPEHATWAVLLDSGYILGPSTKPSSHSSHYSQKDLDDLRKKRVCVECFFGRMTVLWRILLVPYPFDQQHLDVDVDIMIMLTNAHIEERDLHSGDQNSYVRICKLREKEAADVRHKRQQQRDSSMDSAIIATAIATTTAATAATAIAIAVAI